MPSSTGGPLRALAAGLPGRAARRGRAASSRRRHRQPGSSTRRRRAVGGARRIGGGAAASAAAPAAELRGRVVVDRPLVAQLHRLVVLLVFTVGVPSGPTPPSARRRRSRRRRPAARRRRLLELVVAQLERLVVARSLSACSRTRRRRRPAATARRSPARAAAVVVAPVEVVVVVRRRAAAGDGVLVRRENSSSEGMSRAKKCGECRVSRAVGQNSAVATTRATRSATLSPCDLGWVACILLPGAARRLEHRQAQQTSIRLWSGAPPPGRAAAPRRRCSTWARRAPHS